MGWSPSSEKQCKTSPSKHLQRQQFSALLSLLAYAKVCLLQLGESPIGSGLSTMADLNLSQEPIYSLLLKKKGTWTLSTCTLPVGELLSCRHTGLEPLSFPVAPAKCSPVDPLAAGWGGLGKRVLCTHSICVPDPAKHKINAGRWYGHLLSVLQKIPPP